MRDDDTTISRKPCRAAIERDLQEMQRQHTALTKLADALKSMQADVLQQVARGELPDDARTVADGLTDLLSDLGVDIRHLDDRMARMDPDDGRPSPGCHDWFA